MKLGLILTCTALILLLCLPSCTTGASVAVSCDDFGTQQHISKEVAVAVGDPFTVTLCSNPTTGFQWSESAQISDQTVVQQMDHKSLSPGTKEAGGLVGAPGKEVWTFKALKKGTSTIYLEYGRPWEGGEKGAWTFNLTVVVK
jgi:inhibitor of cysteine peptidase